MSIFPMALMASGLARDRSRGETDPIPAPESETAALLQNRRTESICIDENARSGWKKYRGASHFCIKTKGGGG